ncbi:MAG: 4Fe-4S binding protein [Candidatus Lokiarchaeota archaeon]|nr:4Fe-4S binding protein [Candidatus Lokiarchaeota archaeon]
MTSDKRSIRSQLLEKKFDSFLDKILTYFPPLGKVLTTLFGAQEYYMLELFRIIKQRVNINLLLLTNRYLIKGRWGGRVVPLNVNFDPDTRFLPTQEILSILSKSKVTGISTCYCRETQRKYADNPNFDYPLETCIHIGLGKDLQEIPYKSENLRKVTKLEVEKLLHQCDDKGLVHQLIYFPNPQYYYVVCNCDPNYCLVLNGFLKCGSPQMIKSDFIAKTITKSCTNCGICEEWCHFGARRFIDNSFLFNSTNCFGCGICISKCPNKAIKLVIKK